MSEQEFGHVWEVARQGLEALGQEPLGVTGVQAYGALVWLLSLLDVRHPVRQWFGRLQRNAEELADFVRRWEVWQQQERHRLGRD